MRKLLESIQAIQKQQKLCKNTDSIMISREINEKNAKLFIKKVPLRFVLLPSNYFQSYRDGPHLIFKDLRFDIGRVWDLEFSYGIHQKIDYMG
jgi:hypothetical protein